MSIPRALLLVLALLQAVGVVDLVRRVTCEAECKRDGCEDDCAPGNDASQCPCHCPSSAPATPAALEVETTAPATRACEVRFAVADQLHASPDPSEILHVPRQHTV